MVAPGLSVELKTGIGGGEMMEFAWGRGGDATGVLATTARGTNGRTTAVAGVVVPDAGAVPRLRRKEAGAGSGTSDTPKAASVSSHCRTIR
jgi:hypothetical protein